MSRRLIDTSIFDRDRTKEEARRAHRLEHIYHAGQDKLWDGRKVLSELLEKHGGIQMPLDKQRALAKVFSALMWGELAAWKISAQLADSLTDFEAKMAATSQVHDEARHFYVLHDYLDHLDVEIPPLDRPTRMLLESVLATDSLLEKLVGMQLFVESMALTVFKTVRELNVEPVLSDLLLYYERDEARHVGLGVQHTPDLVRGLRWRDRARLDAFQLKIVIAALFSLKSMEDSFVALGVDPRAVADYGKEKMMSAIELLAEANGDRVNAVAGQTVSRIFEASCELIFPSGEGRNSVRRRLSQAARAALEAA
jgi:hypothetical protein